MRWQFLRVEFLADNEIPEEVEADRLEAQCVAARTRLGSSRDP